MLGAGTVINPIIKIITTVAILAAVGIFIVKPVLESTEKISNDVNESINDSFADASDASQAAQIGSLKSRARSYASSLASQWPAAAREVRDCAQAAGNDFKQLNVCVNFGSRLVTQVQSNRNFSLSYADSLRAQGDTAAAAQVEQCVHDAGFETAAMRRCRNLADELLFG